MLARGHHAIVRPSEVGSFLVSASRFLLENKAINGINLAVDGGWMCM